MPYTLHLSNDKTTLTAAFAGEVGYAEIEQAGFDRLGHPDGAQVSIWITDFSDAEQLIVSAEDVQRDVELADRIAKEKPDLTVVAIMPDKFAYGMGRMWQGLAGEAPPVSAHIVQNREEAERLVTSLRGV